MKINQMDRKQLLREKLRLEWEGQADSRYYKHIVARLRALNKGTAVGALTGE